MYLKVNNHLDNTENLYFSSKSGKILTVLETFKYATRKLLCSPAIIVIVKIRTKCHDQVCSRQREYPECGTQQTDLSQNHSYYRWLVKEK